MSRQKWTGEDGDYQPSSRVHWLDPVVLGVYWVENVAEANLAAVKNFRIMLQQHYNSDVDTELFARDAALEIESFVYVDEDEED